MDNQPRNPRRVERFDLPAEELPPRKRPLTNATRPSKETRKPTMGANLSRDQDSKISRTDKVKEQKGKEKVAEEAPPVQKDSSNAAEGREKRKRVVSSERNPNYPVVPPRFHRKIREKLQRPPFFLFKKKLGLRDVESSCNRLYFSSCSEQMWAMTAVPEVDSRENVGSHLRVVTTDPNGIDYEMHLQRLSFMGMHTLGYEWGNFVRANRLRQGDRVQGWGYHVGRELRLALIIIKKTN